MFYIPLIGARGTPYSSLYTVEFLMKKIERRQDLIDTFKFISYSSTLLNKEIDSEIVCRIDSVDWSQFLTSYGSAEPLVPKSLKALFSDNNDISLPAAHYLLCALGDKDVSFSPATFPAYEFLRKSLLDCDDLIKVSVLYILTGIAFGVTYADYEEDQGFFKLDLDYQAKYPLKDFEIKLLAHLKADLPIFEKLALHENQSISEDSIYICECLNL